MLEFNLILFVSSMDINKVNKLLLNELNLLFMT